MSKPTCYLTGQILDGAPEMRASNETYYKLQIGFKTHHITICTSCLDKIRSSVKPTGYQTTIVSLLINGNFNLDDKLIHWDTNETGKKANGLIHFDLKKELEQAIYPKTPKEKLENFFRGLHDMQDYSGQQIVLPDFTKIEQWGKWFFAKYGEGQFYLKALEQQGLINLPVTGKGEPIVFEITFEGLNKYIEMFEEGYNSKYCFIAMAFKNETIKVREAIKNALSKTGFEPLIVDERHIDSDRTINDEIIAGLRRCRFCIADFSYHRHGVYFESGFAVGQGKPVIYTCSQEEFKDAHFDIKPLQHIIYESPDELELRLIHKIDAWIK